MLAGPKMVLAAGFAPALATLSTSCLFCWTTRAKKLDPPAGDAPAESLYKNDSQAAAWRQKWSQSRVLPSAQLAYETGLSAGSIAMLAHGHPGTRPQNGALTRSCTGFARLPSECITGNALRALEMVGARRLARPRLPDSESGGSAFPREPRAEENWRP